MVPDKKCTPKVTCCKFLQEGRAGFAFFEAGPGRTGLITFKPSALADRLYGLSAESSPAEAGAASRQEGTESVSSETYMKALRAVIGQESMVELLSVGWSDDQLARVRLPLLLHYAAPSGDCLYCPYFRAQGSEICDGLLSDDKGFALGWTVLVHF